MISNTFTNIIFYELMECVVAGWSLSLFFSLCLSIFGLGSELGDLRLSDVGALFSLLHLMLNLPEFRHVGVGCFLSLLSLSLVSLHFKLQLVNKVLKPGHVLLILLSLVSELLDSAFVLADSLHSVNTSSCFSLNLTLQFTHPALQFLELLLATLHGQVLSLIQTVLEVLDCHLEVLLHPLKVRAGVLLLLQLFSHHGSISDGLLGLLLSIPGLLDDIVHLSLHCHQVTFKLLLGVQKTGVLGVQQSHSLTGIHQLLLSHFAASLSLLQRCSQLLNLSHHQTVSAVHHGCLLLHVLRGADGVIKVQLGILELPLHIPQLFLGLCCLAVSVAQLDLHLIQVSLHLLLDPEGIVSAADLRIQGALHGFSHPLGVPLDLLHLLILLCQLPVNLTLDLVQLQLHTQDLSLLVLKGSLSLLQGCLDLSLLSLHCLLGLLQFMDTLASLSNLLSQVRDLLLQVLVLSLQSLQLVQSLFVGVLHFEELCAERTSLLLSSLQLSLALLKLLLPLCQNLVKVPLLLVQVGSQAVGPLNINHEVLHLSLQPLLGLL